MKYLIMILLTINIFATDFRGSFWGNSWTEVLAMENLEKVLLKENLKSKNYSTFKGDYQYSYTVDDYSFTDTLESLGPYTVTYSFLKGKLFKATLAKEFVELKPDEETKKQMKKNKKLVFPKVYVDKDNSFEKMKQYLIWKYGEKYKTYGISDTFEWENSRSRIVLNFYENRYYTVEYYANTELMKEFIETSENGKEFTKELGTQYKEFDKVKDKI